MPLKYHLEVLVLRTLDLALAEVDHCYIAIIVYPEPFLFLEKTIPLV